MQRLRTLLLLIAWILYEMAIGWLIAFLRLLAEVSERRRWERTLATSGFDSKHCQVIPPDVYKRPDPLIYCQSYLLSLGLGVTWDNPDIQLYDVAAGMTAINSHDLQPGSEYEIRATIYNGSTDAPAPGMPVEFSFLSFGIGTTSTPIGETSVDLPVRGAPGHPATAAMRWTTPATPGHYCIQVKLIWNDDANPNNNLGQENTDVGAAHSPAVFIFPVKNQNRIEETIRLYADGYRLPDQTPCNDKAKTEPTRPSRTRQGASLRYFDRPTRDPGKAALQAVCASRLRRHELDRHPLPAGWQVTIEPENLTLGPGQEQTIQVIAEPPADFHGTEPINVHAIDSAGRAVGGVTLYTTR
jgi:hypothetical protein